MTQQPIRFKKERELGDILGTMFKFLRENYKDLFKALLKIAGPALLLLLACFVFYSIETVGSFGTTFNSGTAIISVFLLAISYLVYYAALNGTIYHSIKSYIQNDGKIIFSEVASGVKSDFGRLIAISLISAILIGAGMILLIIPGIYLMVPLSMAPAIIVFNRKSTFDSISDCFDLVKDNWWITFASIIVISLIVYIVAIVFQIPTIIYSLVKILTSFNEGSVADPSSFMDTGYIVVNTLSSMIQYIVYGMTPIGFSLIFFNLNEKKNFTGTYETIRNIGRKQ